MKNTYVLILAGGVGSRFWPKSRNNYPKQFIDILGIGKSLLQLTFERFSKICKPENVYILSNEQYKELIKEQLPLLSDENILAEPSRNNTAPCIAYASFKIENLNPEANIIVAPSDHLILKEDVFLQKLEIALRDAEKGNRLFTLGISPVRPDTGYGYIRYDREVSGQISRVHRFLEKPNLERAMEFVASGDYLWNAGIFIWNIKSIMKAFQKYTPELYEIFSEGKEHYNTSTEQEFLLRNYSLSPNISIDYAIMEKADNVYTVPGDFGWSDLGTWASLHDVMEKDEYNNVLSGHKINLSETENCIVQIPGDKIAVIKGLNDYIIVDDGRVLLIYPKSLEQEIKEVSKNVIEICGKDFS
ncbi:mannose-1-phosphate guanylyltransferase [Pedobacter sp. HMWF019]|uniref:mannose-1-phosphate guanylyltransferase n=1 Tax=Pedobacter sp. HMWF019 TaxID=2056856 RepID=UPI000D375039|nr:mannose-1-phosphate guanylyltransferase [Pedobacter sp. HMWF019]PTS95777.1 mannose-1-phosphate guanylyltransferase [Pedobacter sp. HMWF019]